jgi:hypothetical protein
MKSIIRNFIAKRVAGRSDDGIMITLSDPRKVDFQAAMLEDLLMRNGFNPADITSEQQLKNIINQIKAAEAQTIRNMDVSGIRNTESAKVFDLEGKEIPKGSQIMGGKEVPGTSDRDRVRNEMKKKYGFTDERLNEIENTPVDEEMADRLIAETDLPPPGSRGGKDDIAAPVQSQEETMKNMVEAEIKAKLEKQNKDSVSRILERKNREDVYGLEDYDTTNMSEIKKEIIRTETKLGNLNPNLPGFRERAKPLIDKITALQKKLREDKAYGGRIGLKGGADAATASFSTSAGSSRKGRKDPVGGFNLSGGQGPTFGGAPPTTGGGGGGNDNNQTSTTPTISSPMGSPFTKSTMPPSGLVSTLSPSILARIARMSKGLRPILGKDLGLEYETIDDLNDVLTNFKITQDIEDLIKTQKINPELKFKKEIGDNTFFDVGINKEGEAKLQFLKKFAKGGRAGFFMGSQLPKGLATLRTMLNFMGKKSDKVKNPSDVLKMVNPKSLNAMLEDPRLQGKVNVKEGILASDMVKDFQSKMGEDRVQLVRDMLDAAKNIKKSDDRILKYKNEVKERLMKDLNMSEAEADRAATSMSQLAADVANKPSTPKLTDEGILELENVLKNMETGGKKKRDLNADGGRIGLKDGMNRRTFLKLLGGLAAIPIVGKIIKPLKTVKGVKNVPIIKTDNVPGKPEWFDQLVNKVIIEGDDMTKQFATKEREIVHAVSVDEDSFVKVTQDLDEGVVRVEYESPENMYGDPVQLRYKKPNPDEGDPRPGAEFDTAESGPVGRADGPDDYSIEIDEVGGQSISDLTSDVSKLKEYATGQKQTLKEFVQSKKRKDRAKAISEGGENEMDEVIRRQGEFIENDLVDLDPGDYASGGIARMLGE